MDQPRLGEHWTTLCPGHLCATPCTAPQAGVQGRTCEVDCSSNAVIPSEPHRGEEPTSLLGPAKERRDLRRCGAGVREHSRPLSWAGLGGRARTSYAPSPFAPSRSIPARGRLPPCQGWVFRAHPSSLFWGARGEGRTQGMPLPPLPPRARRPAGLLGASRAPARDRPPRYPPRTPFRVRFAEWPLWALFKVDPLGHAVAAASIPLLGGYEFAEGCKEAIVQSRLGAG